METILIEPTIKEKAEKISDYFLKSGLLVEIDDLILHWDKKNEGMLDFSFRNIARKVDASVTKGLLKSMGINIKYAKRSLQKTTSPRLRTSGWTKEGERICPHCQARNSSRGADICCSCGENLFP